MDAGALLIIGLFLVVFVGIVILGVQQGRSRAKFFDQLSQFGAQGEGTSRTMTVGAHQVRTVYHPGGKNQPSSLSLITSVSSPGSFTLAREGSADRFFEGLGLEGKIKSNDPAFDERVHVVSDDDAFASAYFSSPKKREAVMKLLDSGWARIELGEEGLKVVRIPFQPKEGLTVDFIRDSLPPIAALAEELPQGLPFVAPSGLSQKQFQQLFFAAVGVMVVLIFCSSMTGIIGAPLDSGAFFLESIRFGVLGAGAFMLVVAAALKGKSWFVTGIVQSAFVAVMIFPLGGWAIANWANSHNDTGPATTRWAVVLDKHEYHGRNSSGYYLHVQSWRPGRSIESLKVDWRTYSKVVPKTWAVTITTKPGYLHHEWVVDYKLAPLPVPGG
jgi:hypothetical protein